MQNFRGLRVVQAVVNREHNCGPLLGRQSQQSLLRLPGSLVFGKVAAALRGNLLRAIVFGAGSPRLVAPPVQAGVNGDAAKPGGKLRAAREGIEPFIGADECLLRQVLGVGRRAGHPECQRVNHMLVIAHERFKSRWLAIFTLQHQIFVGVSHAACF